MRFLALIMCGVLCSLTFCISAEAENTFPKGSMVVVIDAGHGGADGGSVANGIVEKDINLKIAKALNAIFKLFGVKTVMIRTEDISLDGGVKFNKKQDMNKRIAIINSFENPLLISIHVNKYPSEDCFGAQMFYGKSQKSQELAQKSMLRFKTLQPENNRKIKPISSSLYLYKNLECDILLAECGFISNTAERELLTDEKYLMKVAMALFCGYADWLEN